MIPSRTKGSGDEDVIVTMVPLATGTPTHVRSRAGVDPPSTIVPPIGVGAVTIKLEAGPVVGPPTTQMSVTSKGIVKETVPVVGDARGRTQERVGDGVVRCLQGVREEAGMPIVERDVHALERARALVPLAVDGNDPEVVRRGLQPSEQYRGMASRSLLHGSPRGRSDNLLLKRPALESRPIDVVRHVEGDGEREGRGRIARIERHTPPAEERSCEVMTDERVAVRDGVDARALPRTWRVDEDARRRRSHSSLSARSRRAPR